MARLVAFTKRGWEDYGFWQLQDRRMLGRINDLIRDAQRDPFGGIGKPEPLRGNLAGLWSRRIDDTHRLVYRVVPNAIEIATCRFHYS